MRPTINLVIVTLNSHNLIMMFSLIMGAVLFIKLSKFRRVFSEKILFNVYSIAAIGFFIGAKSFYLISSAERLETASIYSSGFSFYGGALGAITSVLIICYSYKCKPYLKEVKLLLDVFSPVGALTYSIARVGCFMAGCCKGIYTDNEILGVRFPNEESLRLPTQLYSSFISFGIFIFLFWRIRRSPIIGTVFIEYVVLYSIYRLSIEKIRFGFSAIYLSTYLQSYYF
ncbi:MAG: prolipoprotein diacylglyceryl transferase family protein [bacterium]